MIFVSYFFFFFKQKTAYEMRISDWSSDVCSSDLRAPLAVEAIAAVMDVASGYCNLEFDLDSGRRGSRTSAVEPLLRVLSSAESALAVNNGAAAILQIGRASCRERVWQYV